MIIALLILILFCLLFPALIRIAAMLLFFAFLYFAVSMADQAHADGWHSGDDRGGYHGSDRDNDSFRGWRDNYGFLHGNSEDPNYRGTVYCWRNGVWICP